MKDIKTLQDTIELMNSSEYKDRFRAEYKQLDIRIEALDNMLKKYKTNTLPFTPTCSYELLFTQLIFMKNYRDVLRGRALIEEIDLEL